MHEFAPFFKIILIFLHRRMKKNFLLLWTDRSFFNVLIVKKVVNKFNAEIKLFYVFYIFLSIFFASHAFFFDKKRRTFEICKLRSIQMGKTFTSIILTLFFYNAKKFVFAYLNSFLEGNKWI